MKSRLILLTFALVAVIALSGCGIFGGGGFERQPVAHAAFSD